jgi:hypothetical protein
MQMAKSPRSLTSGVFARAGWANGNIEPYEFTDIDRTVAAGLRRREFISLRTFNVDPATICRLAAGSPFEQGAVAE